MDELAGMLANMAQHGLSFDLTPTHKQGDEQFWHNYIRRMDEEAKRRAARMLRLLEERNSRDYG